VTPGPDEKPGPLEASPPWAIGAISSPQNGNAARFIRVTLTLNNRLWRERDGGRDEVRLCDLGCAWARSAVSNGPTVASIFRGTAHFTAPEIMNEEASRAASVNPQALEEVDQRVSGGADG